MSPATLTRAPALLGVLIAAVLLTAGIAALGVDAAWADRLYAWQGGHWLARDAWWSAGLVHTGGRRLSIACWLAVVAAWALSWTGAVPRTWRAPLGYLLTAVPLACLLVAWLKSHTGIDCPWDLQRYGGARPWLSPLASRPATMGAAACFPAAHAAAGYAWVAAYFACSAAGPALRRWRHAALGTGLALGAVFGLVQQLRGAHFLSHDLWSLTLCWLVAAASARICLYAQLRDAERASNAMQPSAIAHRLREVHP
ncbi:phosphatase PAP2 family protein [Luteimonas terrae]|uniref:phosphatase PAP2 family protein n=1 Tax=Luteimonas terrae TaxID=1530191 RepID=UPI001FB570A5|nr:phosphatase PAP2 family protein [Luteimonas terrae]